MAKDHVQSTWAEPGSVAVACGKEVRIFGPHQAGGKRPLIKVMELPHYGAALMFSTEYNERHRPSGG